MVVLRNKKSTEDMMEKELHVVTGGGGYVGVRLGKSLAEKGHQVVLFDVSDPADGAPEGCTFVKGDIRNLSDVEGVIRGADCVYHVASFGMSGREQLRKKLIEDVNIKGTQNVIAACQKYSVKRLVYTSTYNVVFGGQVIENGDESLPYLPLDKHPDWYSRTKSIAEQAILEANGSKLVEGGSLSTCALRLAGVYGPGEQRHLPRIVKYIKMGIFKFTYGSRDSLVDFLHVDNLVLAHILAGEALKRKDSKSAGQAYFISDCKPINNFQFFKPLVEGLGYTYPRIVLPITLIYFIAFITEWVHYIFGWVYNFQPFLTRTEVYKTGVTHYFSNEQAKQHLGYEPVVQNDMKSVLRWFIEHGYRKKKRHPFIQFLLDLTLGILFAICIISFLPFVI